MAQIVNILQNNVNLMFTQYKALKVIESCTTCSEFNSAINYVVLFKDKFRDVNSLNQLMIALEEKNVEIGCDRKFKKVLANVKLV